MGTRWKMRRMVLREEKEEVGHRYFFNPLKCDIAPELGIEICSQGRVIRWLNWNVFGRFVESSNCLETFTGNRERRIMFEW